MPGDLYRFAEPPPASSPILVNGKPVASSAAKGYARIRRRWQKGDVVQLDLPMPIHRVLANDAVAEDRGKAAIQRGPIVYCLEALDNGGHVSGTQIPLDAELHHEFRSDLLGGVEVITGPGFLAVPYYAWNNRGKGEMAVWIPY